MQIPAKIKSIISLLNKSNFEAYIVGGCVRDLLRNVEPKDWDITTQAKPEEIEKILSKKYKTFYENQFGTVGVVCPISKTKTAKTKPTAENPANVVEITTFRTEAKYTDKRHPDEIKWAATLEEDLSRRDFTINAMALAIGEKSEIRNPKSETNSKSKILNSKLKIIDFYGSQEDLRNKIIRAVGEPTQRFNEDALRLIRAVRFAVTLDSQKIWQIEEKTSQAIEQSASLLQAISQERVRDELLKILASPQAGKGIEVLRRLGLLKYILPELLEGFGVEQNKHHVFQVYSHNLLALNYACQNNFSLDVRMAALLHDIGKARTKRGHASSATFYNHEIVGARMAERALIRLRFNRQTIDKIVKLIRWHLFYYNVDEVTPASVRKLLRKVGQDDIENLLQVRYADRIGSGVAKAEPYKLRHLKYLFEKVKQDPIKPTMLKINGQEIMKILNVPPGPKVGQVLNILLSYCLSDPSKNKKVLLKKEALVLSKLSDQQLKDKTEEALADINQVVQKQDKMTKQKYWVT